MRLRILTWHIHGSYLYYLTQAPHEFYLPTKPGKPEGYGGCLGGFKWGDNVHEIPADEVQNHAFDCIIFQSRRNYLQDQYEILSESQRQLPRIYLEHDPPQEHPTNTQHIVNDPNILLAHVTHFNNLMWNSGRTPTCVIEHGVVVPEQVQYTGKIPRGLVVVNGLKKRGRRLGADVFLQAQRSVPLDLIGMDAESLGGLGEVPHANLPEFQANYRFFFHPIRYTSLGLAVCEAMMLGLPIVGLATTELATVIENEISGYIDTNLDVLIEHMQELIANPEKACRLGQGAQAVARSRFSIQRFTHQWNQAFERVMSNRLTLTNRT
ncbi:MAG TPA: glycosyltransferase family 4 protein [Leptolyngbyaceae cyanobacterium M33_DOE_097]|uniref:Glycosyltransferase family 1 protein n=1 Tax=Oscillatoriales cyanobacterium SpSt-418 TaxID=2282169 RepID=A0A7C3KJP8_9CYAN|nr:glycosyltransferase family 4 protein [Leptolyngbyaceae cyanobacterium M33_DOE_097]